MRKKVYQYVVSELKADPEAFKHLLEFGEVNYTALAEELASQFNKEEWLDDETHWIWDLAIEAGDYIEDSTEEYVLNHY